MPELDPFALVDWSVPVPEEAPAPVPILSPAPGTAVRGIVLSSALVGVWTHWFNGRTTPHLLGRGGCSGCREHLSKRWKGYLAIYWQAGVCVGLAELTPSAARACPELIEATGADLRGYLIELARPLGKKNGRVSLRLQPPPYRRAPDKLPPAPDVRACLLRIWDRREDGVSCIWNTGEALEEPPF